MWHTGGNPGIGMKVKRCVQLSIGCWNAFLLELFEITVRQFAWQTAVEIVGSTKYLAKWNCNYRAFIHQSGSVQTRSIGNSILLIRSVPNKVQPCETGHVLFIVPGDFHRQACHVWTVERRGRDCRVRTKPKRPLGWCCWTCIPNSAKRGRSRPAPTIISVVFERASRQSSWSLSRTVTNKV